jgi:hypothetical protein
LRGVSPTATRLIFSAINAARDSSTESRMENARSDDPARLGKAAGDEALAKSFHDLDGRAARSPCVTNHRSIAALMARMIGEVRASTTRQDPVAPKMGAC